MRARPSAVKSRGRAALLGALVVLLSLTAAQAAMAMPASPGLLRRARQDKALAARIAAFERNARAKAVDAPHGKPAAALPGAVDLAPAVRVVATTGTLRSIALLVDFSDKRHTVAASGFDSLLFGDVFGPSSLRGYFREVSYGSPSAEGLLTLTTEHPPSAIGPGWLPLPRTLAYYLAGGDYGIGSYPNNCQKMVEDAVKLADPYVDFSRYDNDNDGEVDNLFVVHAGRGAERTGSPGDIWSHSWGTSSPVSVDGVHVSAYSTEPEYWVDPGDMTIGVYAHEMGHVLGLPDLYDRDYSSAGIGEWSVMAGGSWNGPKGLGASPARFDAWCAAQLGWLQPQTITGAPATLSLGGAAGSRTAAYKLYPDGGTSSSEYFLVENRQRAGTDAALPGSGLLIWHVDETRNQYRDGYQNDTESHKLVDLEEAAGTQSLDSLDAFGWPNPATADDPYPGTHASRTFNDSTTPNARTYSGAASNVVVDQIGDSAATMSARLGSGGGVAVDTTPPHTTVSGCDDAWHATPVTLTFSASDGAGGSGVDYTEYELDDRGWVRGASVTLPADPDTVHIWSVKYRSVDKAGNVETYHTCEVRIDTSGGGDTTPPTVGVAGTSGGYSKHDVTLTLTAADELGGSGVAAVHYTLDGIPREQSGASVRLPIPAVPNGLHVLTYHGRDAAGNEGADETFTITMDTRGPVGSGRSARVRKGRYVKLRYLFRDAYSTRVRTVKVRVKNRAGRTVWRKNLDARALKSVGSWHAIRWRPRARGRYRYYVTCRDIAGNIQARRALGAIRVL